MMARKAIITRADVEALCERLEAGAQSRLMNDRPELQSDLRLAARVLRYGIKIGFPVSAIPEEDDGRRG
jgi:hypothetical protein